MATSTRWPSRTSIAVATFWFTRLSATRRIRDDQPAERVVTATSTGGVASTGTAAAASSSIVNRTFSPRRPCSPPRPDLHRQEPLGRRPDRRRIVVLLVAQLGCVEHLGHPDDAVHRGPDLVAHRRQECALGRIGLVGGRRHLVRPEDGRLEALVRLAEGRLMIAQLVAARPQVHLGRPLERRVPEPRASRHPSPRAMAHSKGPTHRFGLRVHP